MPWVIQRLAVDLYRLSAIRTFPQRPWPARLREFRCRTSQPFTHDTPRLLGHVQGRDPVLWMTNGKEADGATRRCLRLVWCTNEMEGSGERGGRRGERSGGSGEVGE